jgi:hypothetical protein
MSRLMLDLAAMGVETIEIAPPTRSEETSPTTRPADSRSSDD